jgi:hypothetical protein
MILNGHYILRNDPCHQFAFGMTVEDTQARFWYFCRAHAMVFERFNFITVCGNMLWYSCKELNLC